MSLMTEQEYADAAGWDCAHECPRCRRDFEHEAWRGCGCWPHEADADLLCASCERDSADCISGCPNIGDDRKEHSFICARINGY